MSRSVLTPAGPSIPTKAAFGLGSTAEAIALAAIAGYAMFYYNQVLGLRATLSGLAMTVSVVFDGFLDPLIGSISDRTKSRLGRRHPFMFAAPIPSAICLWAVFHPPSELPAVWLFVWFLGFAVSLKIAMSFYHVPHLALGGELSGDYTERTRVMSYSNFLGAVGTTATSFVALSLFFHATPKYPRGLLNPAGYAPFGDTAALTLLGLYAICALWTARQIPNLPKAAPETGPFRPMDFIGDMRAVFSNRNYVFLLIAVFFLAMMVGLRTAMNLYVNTFFWGFTSEQIRWFAFSNLAGFFVSFLASARLHDRFDKRAAMVACAVLLGVVPAIPVILRSAGLFPEPGNPALAPLIMLFGALQAGIGSVLSISVLSALADIADENELRFGLRQEGVLFSTRTVFAKLDSAVGTFLAGVTIDLAGLPQKAAPGHVAAAIVWRMAIVDGPIAIIPGLLAAVFYARYRIDRRRHAETRTKLEAARAAGLTRQAPLSAAGVAGAVEGLRDIAPILDT
jgi:GPH family glycoside/pentoside/hexuronide:cation symporter